LFPDFGSMRYCIGYFIAQQVIPSILIEEDLFANSSRRDAKTQRRRGIRESS